MEELLGHVDLKLARRIINGELRLREQLRYDRRAQADLVRVNGRPGEMVVGYEAWIPASIGFVSVRFFDTEAVEYFTPEQWAAAKREWIE